MTHTNQQIYDSAMKKTLPNIGKTKQNSDLRPSDLLIKN